MREPAAGELNRRVQVRKSLDLPAMDGGTTLSLDAGISAWAKIEPVGNALFFGSQQVGEGVTHRLYIRRSSTLNERTITADQVIDEAVPGGTLRYRVKRANALNGGRSFVLIEAEEIGIV